MREELRQRADFVIEFMKLGMDYQTACVASECTPEMVKELDEDPEFLQMKKFALAKLESDLLKKLNKAAETAALKGETRSIERLLEIIRPDRYAKSAKLVHTVDTNEEKGDKEILVSFVKRTLANGEEEEPEIVASEG